MGRLAREEFVKMFTTFAHTAWRLETRDTFNVPYEREHLAKFLAGEPDDFDWISEWFDTMRAASAQGKRVERVRVVGEPHTDYTRWLLHVSQHNVEAGEDIRYLPRARMDELELPYADFWVFDSAQVAVIQFDEYGDAHGTDIFDDPATVVRHCQWRDAAWHHAIPYRDYVSGKR
jgi:hypothetical protein